MVHNPQDQSNAITSLSEFIDGTKAILPILVGVIPFGLISGVAVVQTKIVPIDGLIMSILIFSGAALIVALQLISTGAPFVVVLLSALAVNLRFMIYSFSLAPLFERLSTKWKSLLAYLLSDQAYAASILHLNESLTPGLRHWHFFGSGITMWLAWQVSVGIGMFVGASLPTSWSLEFTIPLTFLSLAIPTIKEKATMSAALVAGIISVFTIGFPFKLGMVVAALAGIIAGMLMEGRSKWKSG